MYPHERSLVEKLEGKPFVILGVNSDPKDRLKQVIKKENMTWRSWWDGGSTDGPIQRAWNIQSYPSTFVLDAKGVIRFKDVRDQEMEDAVQSLLKEIAK
jgi:peroxiredoxin